MPYRLVYIGNDETVLARVPNEVVAEWLEVREANKGIGYPDRPPDIDTPEFRTWISHPGEKGWEERAKHNHTTNAATDFPVFTAAQGLFGMVAKLLISYESKRGYVFRLKAHIEQTGETIFDQESVSREWDEDKYERMLELFSKLFMDIADTPVMISTYFDFISMESEVELAYKEIEEYYGTA